MKRILSLLMSLVMVFGIVSGTLTVASAAEKTIRTVSVDNKNLPTEHISLLDGKTIINADVLGDYVVYSVFVGGDNGPVTSFVVYDGTSYRELDTANMVVSGVPYEFTSAQFVAMSGLFPTYKIYNDKAYFSVNIKTPETDNLSSGNRVLVETADFKTFTYVNEFSALSTGEQKLYDPYYPVHINNGKFIVLRDLWGETYFASTNGGKTWKTVVLPDMKMNGMESNGELIDDWRDQIIAFGDGALVYTHRFDISGDFSTWTSLNDIYYTEDFTKFEKIDTSAITIPEYDVDKLKGFDMQIIDRNGFVVLSVSEYVGQETNDHIYEAISRKNTFYYIDQDTHKIKKLGSHNMINWTYVVFTDAYGFFASAPCEKTHKVVVNDNKKLVEYSTNNVCFENVNAYYDDRTSGHPIRYVIGLTSENKLFYTSDVFKTVFLIELTGDLEGAKIESSLHENTLLKKGDKYYSINSTELKEYIDETHKHTLTGWITDQKATVNAPGKKHRECKECGKVVKTAKIAQLKCATPELLKVTNTTSGVKFTWKKVTGADSYVVYRKTGNGSWKQIAKNIKTTSYTDKTAKKGVTYKYTVKAKNEAGLSGYNTKGLSIKRLTTPVLKSVSSAKSGVTLKWNKVTGAGGYVVYRKTGNGSWVNIATVKGNAKVTYLDKKAKKGTTYRYTVRAYYGKTYSAYNTNGLKIKDKY